MNIHFDGCADRWNKDANYRQQMSEKKSNRKAEMELWDTVMNEHLGEDMFYSQPSKLREEIHTGRLKIKQARGQARPLKQQP